MKTPTKQEFAKGENEINGNLSGPWELEKKYKLFHSFHLFIPSKDDIS